MRNILALAIVSMMTLSFPGLARAAVIFDWATVGNAGNAADQGNLRGAVGYEYRIATTEVTNAQYTAFLNAVDPTAANQRGLYNQFMDENFGGGGILNSGTVNGARYSVTPGFEQYPVSLVSWFSAVRFINWLHNGQHGGSTESGAYTLLGGTPRPSNEFTIARSSNARYFMPTQDEWYKAAFHDTNAGTAGVYFDYAMGTNTIPYSDNPASLNTPDNSNAANFFRGDTIANGYNDGYAVSGTVTSPVAGGVSPYTNVGAYTLAASPYGTFDQNGNVREMTETLITLPSNTRTRVIRGGSWADEANTNEHSLIAVASGAGGGGISQVGFRVGSVLGVPDPSNYLLSVQYRTPEVSGPLIAGFNPLPATITATFTLGNVFPGQTTFGLDQVLSFDLEIPGDNPTQGDLDYFQLSLDAIGTPSSLDWGVNAHDYGPGIIVLGNNNFMLDISGSDPDTGEEFRYFYSESTNTFVAVPEPSGLVLMLLTAAACTRCRRRSGCA